MTNLQEIRKKRGLTQSELAGLSGISLRTLQHYERGEFDFGNIGVSAMIRLSVALGCRLSDLLDGDAKNAAVIMEKNLLMPFS